MRHLIFILLTASAFAQSHRIDVLRIGVPPTGTPDVAYDANGSNTSASASSLGATITVGSGSNRALVCIITRKDGSAYATGVSSDVNGALTMLSRTNDAGAGFGLSIEIWYLANPTAGAHTVTATWAAAAHVRIHVVSFTGVDQSTPVDGYQGGYQQNVASKALTVTSATGSMVYGAVHVYGTETITDAQTTRTSPSTTSVSSTATGAASVNFSYSFSGGGTADVIMAACNVRKAP